MGNVRGEPPLVSSLAPEAARDGRTGPVMRNECREIVKELRCGLASCSR